MRPACIRNARSLASQPSPLLPLLAPRAFAAPRNRTGQDDCRPQKEHEKTRWKGARKVADARASDGTSLGARYVDIFSFAKRQLRSYSSSVDAANADGSRRWDRRRLHTDGSGKGDTSGSLGAEQLEKTAEVIASQRFSGRAGPELGDPSTRQEPQELSNSLESQRKRKLAHLQQTLGYFMEYEAPNFPDLQLSEHGKYRSLQRRISALSLSEPREVGFTAPYDPKSSGMAFEGAMLFAALDKRVFADLEGLSHPITLRHHESCAEWVASLFNKETSEAKDVWEIWTTFSPDIKEGYWPHILIYILDKNPQQALLFLQVLNHQPCVRSLDVRFIADAFEHLARLDLNQRSRSSAQREELPNSKPEFVPAFYHVFKEHLLPHKRICSQDLLYSLAKLGSTEDLRRVFDLFKQSNTYMGYDTLLHYAARFAEAGDVRYGLQCLKVLADSVTNPKARDRLVNERRFKWTCALILHRSMLNQEAYHQTTNVVGAFVELGVKLDILLYNVVMHNAMEAGDYSTAFKVFNTLEENGLKADKYTFSTLLHGCTTTSDPARFEDFAQYSAETAKEMKDPWLAADYLYYRYVRLYRDSSSPEEYVGRSNEMIQTYLQFFSPLPLQSFWPGDIQSPQVPHDGDPDEPLSMDPPPMVLYLMLELEILKASHAEASQVWPLYQRFRQRIRNNQNPHLTNLARNPIIWNAFLLAFCRAKNFSHASLLVHEMPQYDVHPDIYTWNIFMQAFFKDRQIRAAERVFEIMRARGIEPDQFSYEVMLRGYARSQHVHKIGGVIEHISEERQESPQLLRALTRVHDQERLMAQLERERARRERRHAAKAKAKQERERRRWAPPKFESMVGPLLTAGEREGEVKLKPLIEDAGGMSFGSLLKK